MRNPYANLLRTPGARRFVIAAFVGRLPLSMLGLGTVLLVRASYGSYGVAGAVAATLPISMALIGTRSGRLVDRFGQRRVLLPALGAHTTGIVALVVSVELHAPRALLFVAAFVAGSTFVSLGVLVRARWSALLGGTPALQAAFALESVIDEIVFTLGPVLVTVLATTVAPMAGLLASLTFTVLGSLAFAAQRATEPPLRKAPGRRRSVLRAPGMALLVVAFAAGGTAFGAIDVSMVAFAQEHGARIAAGPLLALLAIGSGISGAVYGARSWRMSLERRLRISLVLLCAAMVPLALADDFAQMVAAVALGGFAIAPSLIVGFGLVEALVPPDALTEGFTRFSTSIAAGVALGFALAGQVVDATSGHAAFRVALAASAFAAFVAIAGGRRLSPRSAEPPARA